MKYVSVMFKGRNGSGECSLTMPSLAFGALLPRVVHVQMVFSDASDGTLSLTNSTDQFLTTLNANGTIQQDAGNDWSDALFLAVLEIP
jgi:hypothetical protein